MERRFFIKGLTAAIAAVHLLRFNPSYAQVAAPTSLVTPLRLNLSGAGRLGFYIDYSELDTVGAHTFYVCRTHGTTGSVSVTYATGGDVHDQVTGSLSWGDGEADIKSFTVTVPSKQNGDHRMWALLSNPSGGAALQFGSTHTRAYGVIDDGTISTDAVFYDSNAAVGGDGSLNSPYNNLVTAISNLGSARYLYGKGTTIVDNTFPTDTIEGWSGQRHIRAPATRSGESTRAYIRNWPKGSWTIQGDGSNMRAGFWGQDGKSYHTYRGINFRDLDSSGKTLIGFGIQYHWTSGNPAGINIELCAADNINGGTNNSAFGLWGVDGYKLWRCTGNNIQDKGSSSSMNTAMFFTYDGKNGSVQRCESTNCGHLVYQKRVDNNFDASTAVRFCIDNSEFGVHYGTSGGGGSAHSYTIVQGNLFKSYAGGYNGFGIYHKPGGSSPANSGEKHWWCGNVFNNRAGSFNAPIDMEQAFDAAIFNNIFYNCSRMWAEQKDTTTKGNPIAYADYNLDVGASDRYKWKGIDYDTSALLASVNSNYARNDISGNPQFVDVANDDYHLQSNSPARNSGVSSTDMGVYLTGAEIIGANGGIASSGGPVVVIPPAVASPPAKTSLSVEILPSS